MFLLIKIYNFAHKFNTLSKTFAIAFGITFVNTFEIQINPKYTLTNKMDINLLMIAKTQNKNIEELMNEYLERLKHYTKLKIQIIQTKKTFQNIEQQKTEDCKLIEQNLIEFANSNIILLDETGIELSSKEFAAQIENWQNKFKKTIFVIGGAYGFTNELKPKYSKLSLSKMTMPHQLVRLFFVEQLYRAFTIIKGENYHH